MENSDTLLPVPEIKWANLPEIYNGEHDYVARVTIATFIYNVKKDKAFPGRILAPRGEIKNGLVVILRLNNVDYEISVFSHGNDLTELENAIEHTKTIDWSSPNVFYSVFPDIRAMLVKILLKKGIDYNSMETSIAELPKELGSQLIINLPDGVSIETLGPEFAKEVDDNWPHQYPGSDVYFDGMLRRGAAIGLFNADELCGWILRSAHGDLQSLHIKPEHRRKGYAQFLVNTLSKKIADEGIDVFACVVIDNIPSRELFTKLGFKLTTIGTFLITIKDHN